MHLSKASGVLSDVAKILRAGISTCHEPFSDAGELKVSRILYKASPSQKRHGDIVRRKKLSISSIQRVVLFRCNQHEVLHAAHISVKMVHSKGPNKVS